MDEFPECPLSLVGWLPGKTEKPDHGFGTLLQGGHIVCAVLLVFVRSQCKIQVANYEKQSVILSITYISLYFQISMGFRITCGTSSINLTKITRN